MTETTVDLGPVTLDVLREGLDEAAAQYLHAIGAFVPAGVQQRNTEQFLVAARVMLCAACAAIEGDRRIVALAEKVWPITQRLHAVELVCERILYAPDESGLFLGHAMLAFIDPAFEGYARLHAAVRRATAPRALAIELTIAARALGTHGDRRKAQKRFSHAASNGADKHMGLRVALVGTLATRVVVAPLAHAAAIVGASATVLAFNSDAAALEQLAAQSLSLEARRVAAVQAVLRAVEHGTAERLKDELSAIDPALSSLPEQILNPGLTEVRSGPRAGAGHIGAYRLLGDLVAALPNGSPLLELKRSEGESRPVAATRIAKQLRDANNTDRRPRRSRSRRKK